MQCLLETNARHAGNFVLKIMMIPIRYLYSNNILLVQFPGQVKFRKTRKLETREEVTYFTHSHRKELASELFFRDPLFVSDKLPVLSHSKNKVNKVIP